MFRICTVVLMCFVSQLSISQIKTTKVADKNVIEENTVVQAFDSTKNFVGEEVYSLVGQVLYTPPKRKSLQEFGYGQFLLDYKEGSVTSPKSNIYKCCDGFNSKYSELKEKYFTVLDVHEHPRRNRNPSMFGSKYYLELQEKESEDIVFFEYDTRYSKSFCFIVMGFYEKEKVESLGKEFILLGKNWRETVFNEDKPLYDIQTGDEVRLVSQSVWEVTDLTIEEEYFTLSYIIENDSGNKISLDVNSANNHKRRTVFEKDKVEHIIENHAGFWDDIIEGKIAIGMTEEMVKLSWGEPEEIRRTSYNTQWIYTDQYLYFKSGKLTAFN